MAARDIVVVGASAGGVEALVSLVKDLPADLPAALCFTLHLGPGSSALPQILTRAGELPAGHPVHGEPLRRGRIYVAPPDQHLLLGNGRLLLARGPRENSHRPAVDVLFRSAAQSYGTRVIGVLLTGNLDDGTAGLLAVKELGGIAVVQDPAEADYPGMPRSALANVQVDHVVPLSGVAALLTRLTREVLPEQEPAAASLPAEGVAVAEELAGESGQLLGVPSGFTCPDCGGALWETHDRHLLRYRCRTGHAFSPETLSDRQTQETEDALWAALRTLEESIDLSRHMAHRMHARGLTRIEGRYLRRAADAERHAATLRAALDPPA